MVSKSSLWAVAISAPLVLSCNATALSGMDVDGGTDDASTSGCVGRQCDVNLNCPAVMGPTMLSGTVTIPAGTLPLYNAKVYIPSGAVPGEPTSGASCDRCD